MTPSAWMYGGFHHDPGSRQRFLEELSKRPTAPHFVAVEWEKSVFERFAALRPGVVEGLRSRWHFLTPEDCGELSLALAWEGDAYTKLFPTADLVWLESEFQEADLQRHGTDAGMHPRSIADNLLERLGNPSERTMREFMGNISPPPEPRSKEDLIDRVWKKTWSEADGDAEGFERDTRWAITIGERSSGLHNGWIAIVVGWSHANPAGGNQRLRGLLLSKGFSVNSVRLGP